MKLDEKAKRAARQWAIESTSDGGVSVNDYINGILNAYLSALTPAEAGGLVERLREDVPEAYGSSWHNSLHLEAADAIEHLSAALASERAAHAETKRERDEARQALREARREISKTHKNAVKHENCERQHCPICEGGLFQCADCGAAEIETEQRVCTGSETRLAEALKALEPFAVFSPETEALNYNWVKLTYAHGDFGQLSIGDFRAARRVLEGGKHAPV